MRAAIYARISDADGDTQHLGINRQVREAREYCARIGLQVVAEYPEDDRSASKFATRPREQYSALFEFLREGGADAVVARHPDRLWRRPKEAEEFLDLADGVGIALHFVDGTQGIDASNPAGRAMLRVALAFAALESDVKSQRIRSKHRELAEAGAWHGGPTPYGLKRTECGSVELNEAEARVIRECVDRVLAGSGLAQIVDDLNARAVPTPSGKPWRISSLRAMLTSARIAGLREHHGTTYKAQWPPVISEEEARRVRAALSERGGRRTRRRSYILSGGIAVCGKCLSWLHAQPRMGDRRSYRCLSSKGGCSGISIAAEPFESLVQEMLFTVGDIALLNSTVDALELAAAIEDDQRLLEELSRDRADRVISREEHLAARQHVDARLQANKARQARSALAQYSGRGQLRAAWPDLTSGEKRSLLAAAFDRIIVHPGRPGPKFDPDRVEPIWAR